MNANLVRPARVQIRFDQRETVKPQTRAPVRASRAAVAAAGGHARATAQVARDGQLDAAAASLDLSVEKREIRFLDEPLPKLLHELPVSRIGLRDHDGAGSAFVEAMDDPGPHRAADRRKPSARAEAA